MAINFPDSPSTNDTHTVGDKTWTWNGTYWHLNQNSSTYYAQDGVPSNPDGGDFWFESDTGQLFVRYDSAWVEIGHATDFGSSMSDADGDTLIQLEEGSDEDIIRFDTGGTERMTIAANGAVNVGGTLTAGAFSGPLTGNVTGNTSGSSGSSTGNAATATALATGRTINGVSFDGTGNVTVTAAAGTLSGSTLASGVTASSLTSVGALTALTVTGDLTVNGTTTTINSTTLTVDDKNIELGSVATPSDTTADGGGITLKGASDKTILWTNSTDTWDFNQGINVTAGDITLGTSNAQILGPASGAASAGNVSYSFSGDTDTGFFRWNTNTFSAATAGATRMTWAADGSVGIGTTAPTTYSSTSLHLAGSGTTAAIKFTGTSTGAANTDGFDLELNGVDFNFVLREVGALKFWTSTAERMRITAAGNVGIGTTTPGYLLETGGDVRIGGGGDLRLSDSSATGTTANDTILYNDAETLSFWVNGAARAKILSDGTVSIGKTSNDGKNLEVYQASNAAIRIQNSTTGTGTGVGLLLEQNGTGTYIWNYSNGAMLFGTNNGERMRILAGGNVGIGTTSPAAPLQVNTTASDAATLILNTTHASSKRCRLQFAYGGTLGWEWGTDTGMNGATDMYAYNRAQNVIAMVIKDDGKVGIGTSTPGLKLHVYTTASTDGILLDGSTFPAITLQGAGTTRGYIGVATGSGGFVNNSATGDVIIRSNGAKLHLATSQTAASLTCNSSSICIADAALHSYTTWGAPKLQVHGPVHIKNWTGTPASSTELLDWPHTLLHITTKSNYAWARLQSWGYSNDAPYNTSFDAMWNLGIYQNSTNNLSVSNSGTDLKFAGPGAFAVRAGGAERFIILNTGYVGIGNSTPVLPLDVAGGDATSQGAIIRQRLMVRHVDGKSWNDAGLANSGALYFNYGRSSACYINWTGSGSTYVREEALTGSTMVMTGGKVGYTTSRAALKDNVRNVTGAVDLVKRMRPVRFNFKPSAIGDGTNEMVAYDERVGFIAEEMADISHEFATWAWFGDDDKPLMVDPEMNEDGTGGSYIDGPSQPPLDDALPIGWESGAVASVTVAALKELIARVEALESA